MIRKHTSNRTSSKITLFRSILVYVLHIIKKLKSRKNNYRKHTNKISDLEIPKRQPIDANTESCTFKQL